jgi:hypothetical protein
MATFKKKGKRRSSASDAHLNADLKLAGKLPLTGTVVVIDPSIGSTSSLPGYAVYVRRKLKESGVLQVKRSGSLQDRLQQLAKELRALYKKYDPDVLVYEEIPPRRYGGGNAEAHASLLKSVGAILSVTGPKYYIRIKPLIWKKLVTEEYEKGDEADAIEMGRIVLELSLAFVTEYLQEGVSNATKAK